MDRTLIREKYAELSERVAAARGRVEEAKAELEAEYARLRALQSRCKHPDDRHYDVGFDSGSRCPDCGRAT